jgi:hypothetical protein
MINEWREADTGLREIMENSPSLAEAKQLAADLHALDQIAKEAIDSLDAGKQNDQAWRDARLKTLDDIAKPKAALEIVVVAGVKKLVNAASTQ